MFGAIPFVLVLALGCSTTPEPEPETPATAAQERAAPPGAMGGAKKGKSPRSKAGAKGKQPAKGKAGAKGKQPAKGKAGAKGKQPAKGKATAKGKQPAKGKASGDSQPALGVAGTIKGALALDATGTDASSVTKATLSLTWDGGEKALSLGEIKGNCTDEVPAPITAGEKQITPLWSVSCDTPGEHDAKIAIVQSGTTLAVRRAMADGEKLSPWRTLKRVKLVEGASVERGEAAAESEG